MVTYTYDYMYKDMYVYMYNKYGHTAVNTRLALRPPFGGLGFRKTPFGLRPLRYFAPPQFASPANLRFAYSGCQTVANLKRYAKGRLNWLELIKKGLFLFMNIVYHDIE